MNVRQAVVRMTIACAAMLGAVSVVAEDNGGIPKHEREIADEKGFEGPTETTGIESSLVLGSISLSEKN